MHGWLILDKPEGISSAGALNQIKRYIKPYKIGHAGTLDPFASGVLLVAIGQATKLVKYAITKNKSYLFTVNWGENRDSLDVTGKITETNLLIPTAADIIEAIKEWSGCIEQVPPDFSAISINGNRSYKLARCGQKVDLKSRLVFLSKLQLMNHSDEKKESDFFLECGKGFYVRSLARDLADKLGTCGYVSSLRRLSIEKFSQINAIKLDYIIQMLHNGRDSNCLNQYLIPLYSVLDDILVHYISAEDAKRLHNGQKIKLCTNNVGQQEVVACNAEDKKLVAICRIEGPDLVPIRGFNFN